MSHRFYFMYESTSLKEILPSLTGSTGEFKDTVCIFKEKTNTHVWKGKGQDLSSWQYLQTSTDILNRGILLGAFTLSEGFVFVPGLALFILKSQVILSSCTAN